MLNRIYIVSALALFSCSTQSDNQNNTMADSSKNFITSEKLLAKQDVIAPDAKVIPHVTEIHNLELNDDYFWMRLSDAQKEAKTPDDQTQDVLDYLNAENDYKESALAPTKDFQSELFDEIVGRIVKDDESVPVFYRGYWYWIL